MEIKPMPVFRLMDWNDQLRHTFGRLSQMVGRLLLPLLVGWVLAGCGSPEAVNDGLKVTATTTLIGDVVRQVGGQQINLTVMLPVGTDPHTFEPRPQEMAALSEAQVVLINGLGLEEAMQPVLEANIKGTLVDLSQGIETLPFVPEHGDADSAHATGDPHTWTDPNNVMIWAENIAAALGQADPANAETYRANAEAYKQQLSELDSWIRQQVEQIPPEQRKLVTDHEVLGYFARQYGFEQVGLVVPAISTSAAPSAQELAALEDAIRAQGVRAIFVGKDINPALASQVAQDTGIKLVYLYSGSLSEAGGPADNYLDFMRFNVESMVEALK
jgi:manganese/iron transport system substrate-binding protein